MTTSTYIPVGRYTDEYCKALTENFKRDSKRSMEYNLKRDPNCTYSKDQLAKIVSGTAKLDKFRYYEGKKYLKVVREEFDTLTPQCRNTTKEMMNTNFSFAVIFFAIFISYKDTHLPNLQS